MAQQVRAIRVLLTGFEPFGGETVNPSAEAVGAAVRDGCPDLPGSAAVEGAAVELAAAVLPVELARALPVLDAAMAAFGPDVVLAFGQAGGRSGVTPERIAVNLEEAAEPDNTGTLLTGRPVVPGGPAAHLSSLPVAQIVTALHAAGIPASTSTTAGAYLCNHVFYGLMHRVAGGLRAPSGSPVMAGFVHVPYAHTQVLDRPGVASLAQATIDEAVRVVLGACVAALVAPAEVPDAISGSEQLVDAG